MWNKRAKRRLPCGVSTAVAIIAEPIHAFSGCCDSHACAFNRARSLLGHHAYVTTLTSVAVHMCISLQYRTRKSASSNCILRLAMYLAFHDGCHCFHHEQMRVSRQLGTQVYFVSALQCSCLLIERIDVVQENSLFP